MLHPRMADLYWSKVEELPAALRRHDTRWRRQRRSAG